MTKIVRIYQGLLDQTASEAAAQHFEIYQAAINYYLLALAAQESRTKGPIADLRAQLPDYWDAWVDRRGARRPGMRTLLGEWLASLAGRPVERLEDALHLLQPEAGVDRRAPPAALDLLLENCQGDGAIQQGGRNYWPRFCDPNTNPTWDYQDDGDALDAHQAELAALVHGEPTAEEMKAFASRMRLDWAKVKLEPGKFKTGEEAKARLAEAMATLDGLEEGRQFDILQQNPAEWQRTKAMVAQLPLANLSIPGNRKANKELTAAALIFQFVPNDLSRRLLACSIAQPKKAKANKRQDPVESRSWKDTAREIGGDPIKLSRGSRGYVFPAFSALPLWNPKAAGEHVWKEFDIAAFKGALLTLNQIRLKTEERAARRQAAEKVIHYMEGTSSDLKGTTYDTEGSDLKPAQIGRDSRWTRLKTLLDQELAISNEFTEGEETSYALRTRTLRGYEELREKWQRTLDQRKSATDSEIEGRLLDHLHKYQTAEARNMGSATLLTALCKPQWWDLWAATNANKGWIVDDLLEAHAEWLELHEEMERFNHPIRFTPADPKYSPRYYDFTGVTDKQGRLEWGATHGELSVGLATRGAGKVQVVRRKLCYSAPRLIRDGVANLVSAAAKIWCPPVLAALETVPRPSREKELACNLMPHPSGDPRRGMVLNFPATLLVDPLKQAMGDGARWRKAFNAASNTEFLHLLWPNTANKDQLEAAWWRDKRPFEVLSIDLGQRTAGAASRLRAHCDPAGKQTWTLGSAEGTTFWAELKSTRLLRLPGEDSEAEGADLHEQEGRSASPQETEETRALIRALGQDPEGFGIEGRSFPRQNDKLLVAFRRAQGRLRRHLRWLWLLSEPDRTAKALEEIADHKAVPEWSADAKLNAVTKLVQQIGAAAEDDRQRLPTLLQRIAHRIAPHRDKRWMWAGHPEVADAFCLQLVDHHWEVAPKVRGQRGLSLERLEQVDELRRRVQAHNRLHQRKPGTPPPSPKTTRNQPMPEPAQALLDKLEELKRQRVNQTAHLILAEALGLRLREHRLDPAKRAAGDHHGEYEAIPGRRPVDLLVLEDLSRYLASQGQGRSENARLMKWCHRQILDKLRQLLEPFGIPLLTVNPAYSSRFCSRTGVPGFRAVEVSRADAKDFAWKQELDGEAQRPGEDHMPLHREAIREAFQALEDLHRDLGDRPGKPPFTLLLPRGGGPLFVPASCAWSLGSTTQADLNAAINLGLRALASPEAWSLLPRVAVEWQDHKLLPRGGSKLLKARFNTKTDEFIGSDEKDKADNLFYVDPEVAKEFGKTVQLKGRPNLQFLTGRILWGRMKNDLQWKAIRRLNAKRIAMWREKYGIDQPI